MSQSALYAEWAMGGQRPIPLALLFMTFRVAELLGQSVTLALTSLEQPGASPILFSVCSVLEKG